MGKKTRKGRASKPHNNNALQRPIPAHPMAKDFNDVVNQMFLSMNTDPLDVRSQEILNEFRIRRVPLEETKLLFRELIGLTGTDLSRNDADEPFGPGDQSRVATEQHAQIFRCIWNRGADMEEHLCEKALSAFTMHCILGNKAHVERILKATPPEDHYKLLDRRETSFRATPLILTMGYCKDVRILEHYTGFDPDEADFVGVASLLLKYGAKPDVKDVAGKTPVHWGAGSVCNAVTRQIADMCIRATKSCKYYGQEVQLKGLQNKPEYNGLTGILGGYLEDLDRRVVKVQFLDGTTKDLSLRPENIFRNGNCVLDTLYNLVDTPDRLGSVALHEVIPNGDFETAKLLCDHDAAVDVKEINNETIRTMSMAGSDALDNPARRYIKKHVCCKEVLRSCENCNRAEASDAVIKTEQLFKRCDRCHMSYYCSRECQLDHWPVHKTTCKKCKPIIITRSNVSTGTYGFSTYNFNTPSRFLGFKRYNPPTGVQRNEKFWIKVYCCKKYDCPHLIHDETKTCEFEIDPGTLEYEELRRHVRSELKTLGIIKHFQAKFDENSDVVVYLHTGELKTW